MTLTRTDAASRLTAAEDAAKMETPVAEVTRPKRKRNAAKAASSADVERPERPGETKAATVLRKLRNAKGVTIDALTKATGWQPHSVRGFLSGTVKKKLGIPIVSELGKDGARRYRIDATSAGE